MTTLFFFPTQCSIFPNEPRFNFVIESKTRFINSFVSFPRIDRLLLHQGFPAPSALLRAQLRFISRFFVCFIKMEVVNSSYRELYLLTVLFLYSNQQISTCIAFACLVDFDRDVIIIGSKYEERYDFSLAVFVIGFVVCLLVFFVFLLSLEGKITSVKNWNLLVSILICLGKMFIRVIVDRTRYTHRQGPGGRILNWFRFRGVMFRWYLRTPTPLMSIPGLILWPVIYLILVTFGPMFLLLSKL